LEKQYNPKLEIKTNREKRARLVKEAKFAVFENTGKFNLMIAVSESKFGDFEDVPKSLALTNQSSQGIF